MHGPERIGKYLVERALGAGSFATVWLAFDELLETRVAIKVLADNWARSDDVRRRFIGEARILRRIDHDSVVRVHDVDELPDGRPYFVMAWADAGTLDAKLGVPGEPALSTMQALDLTIEICEALDVIHDFGVVHRDIKPSNVLFRSVRSHERASAARAGRTLGDEVVMLGDFGLARDTAASGFTLAAGTPAYMAPEQASAAGSIDHRADVYSVTALMFELLTGDQAFASGTLSGVRRRPAESAIPRLSDAGASLDPRLQEIVTAGLDPEPDRRIPSATALADALRHVLTTPMRAGPDTASAGLAPPKGATLAAPHVPPPAPPDGRRIPLPTVGVAGRVHDLVVAARHDGVSAETAALLDTADELLTRPLLTTVITSGNADAAAAAWSMLGVRAAAPTITALRDATVTIRKGRATMAVGRSPQGDVRIPVRVDASGAVSIAVLPQALRDVDAPVIDVAVEMPGPATVEVTVSPDADRSRELVASADILAFFAADSDPAAAERAIREQLKPATTGPLTVDVFAGGDTVRRWAGRLRRLADELGNQRGPAVRASSGIRMLVAAIKTGEAGPRRTRLLAAIDELRAAAPVLAELDLLRDLAAGRVTVPKTLLQIVKPLFLYVGLSDRLRVDPESDEVVLLDAVRRTGEELRVLENTGRVPFGARAVVTVAQQSLDRLHEELTPGGPRRS